MIKDKSVLVIMDDEEHREISIEALEEQKYRAVFATNGNEARLKFSNEKFHMVIIDMNVRGLKASEYVEGIRRKEGLRNVKDIIPVLVTGDRADIFTEQFALLDNIKYLESPFTKLEFKKKLLTFTGHSDVISSNTTQVRKDEYLITEGGTSHEMYWVLAGTFIITKMNQDGNNVIIGRVLPGELVGEMSFLDNLPRSASVRAETDAEILVIPHKKFIDVLEGQPRWFKSLMQTMSHRLRGANKMIARKVVDSDKGDPHSDDEEDVNF